MLGVDITEELFGCEEKQETGISHPWKIGYHKTFI